MRAILAHPLMLTALVVAALSAAVLPPIPAAITVAVLTVAAVRIATRRPPAPGTPASVGAAAPAPGAGALESIVRELDVPLLLLDDLHAIVATSRGAAALFDTSPDAIRGRSLIRATGDHHLLQAVREATGEPVELRIGADRQVRASAHRVHVGPVHVVLAIEDLTALRAAQRARTDLVANVSHELRTPITAALALAETLESGVPDEQRRAQFHRQLTTEIERLGMIVDRLLRLSRIEWADEQFTLEALRPAELLATAAGRIQPIVPPDQRVAVEPTDAPPVLADRERVLEVIANLLDNALRFSPPGGTVTLSAVASGREVQFAVQDEGPGILPSERARVFERFYTGDRARTTGAGGSGLGLAIAHHIVSRHRGRIWVAPSERGTLIRFTLPFARDAELRAAGISPEPSAPAAEA